MHLSPDASGAVKLKHILLSANYSQLQWPSYFSLVERKLYLAVTQEKN